MRCEMIPAVIPTTTVVGLRCSACGREDENIISLFVFGAFPVVRITCGCGNPLVSVTTKNRRRFLLSLICPVCHETHSYHLLRSQMWAKKHFFLHCPQSGKEIASGTSGKAGETSLSASGNGREYFQNRAVMCAILDRLHQMVSQGSLYCQCGNLNLELEIHPDKIGFYCEQCGAWGSISAQLEADREAFAGIDEIQLIQNTRTLSPKGASNEPTRSRKKRNI
ncbi:MAG: hypothetical protein QHH02_00200 [Syntrophomonadaceae bacterium]|nr:hypothetical protein [Syntrophomonadaceae bacterium]